MQTHPGAWQRYGGVFPGKLHDASGGTAHQWPAVRYDTQKGNARVVWPKAGVRDSDSVIRVCNLWWLRE
jgi:hypothetical protein